MENVIANLLRDFEQGKMSRRQLIQSLTLAAAAASATSAHAASGGIVAKAVNLNHISYQVADYAKSRDWYANLFGMRVVGDDGKTRANLWVGESQLAIHNRKSADQPIMDHICFTLANWDEDKSVRPAVEAEIKRRGLEVLRTSEHSIFLKDPDGVPVQIGGKDQ